MFNLLISLLVAFEMYRLFHLKSYYWYRDHFRKETYKNFDEKDKRRFLLVVSIFAAGDIFYFVLMCSLIIKGLPYLIFGIAILFLSTFGLQFKKLKACLIYRVFDGICSIVILVICILLNLQLIKFPNLILQ